MTATREQVVAEAKTWIGTPYHRKGRVKGAGADCFTFIAEVMITCGLFGKDELPPYGDDWFHHTTDDVYIKLLLRHAKKFCSTMSYSRQPQPILPGNIVTVRAAQSKIFNHGAIVVEWPIVIHAIAPAVGQINASLDPLWAYSEIEVFDPFDKVDKATA